MGFLKLKMTSPYVWVNIFNLTKEETSNEGNKSFDHCSKYNLECCE